MDAWIFPRGHYTHNDVIDAHPLSMAQLDGVVLRATPINLLALHFLGRYTDEALRAHCKVFTRERALTRANAKGRR